MKSIQNEVLSKLCKSNTRLRRFINNIIDRKSEDIVDILSKFFPAEEISEAFASVVGLPYVPYSEAVNIEVDRVQDSLIISKNNDFYTYLMDLTAINRVINRFGSRGQLKIISKASFEYLYNKSKVDSLEKVRSNIQDILSKYDDTVRGEKLFNYMIEQAIYRGASDVHVEYIGRSGSVIRFRVAGSIETFANIDAKAHTNIIRYIKSAINQAISERESRKDGRMQHSGIDIRVNIMPAGPYIFDEETTNERSVLRILRKNTSITFSLNNLPLDETELDAVKTAIKASYGMILTSGPTSSGKTTTLYALMSNIDALSKKVITIEDPIEFSNPYLWHQHQVSETMTFDEIIKGVLREDPDVCLIGEIRDKTSAQALVKLANTGHLTFSTIHANNSYEIIRRLNDLGVDMSAIRDFGIMFMAQRLLRKSCPHCRIERKITVVEKELLKLNEDYCMDNEGCEHCEGTGVIKERVMVMEIMPLFLGRTVDMIARGEGYYAIFDYLEGNFGVKRIALKAFDLNKQGIVSMSEIMDKVK
jgi:type II secretory ATPase GspE/PulE/Tfp pilus assembly ATPase PilB-like protein